ALTFLLARVRSWWCAVAGLGLGAGVWGGCTLLLSATGLMLSPVAATAAMACAFLVVTLLNYLEEKQRADRTARQLSETQKLSMEALRESEARYRRLVENINDAIIMNDPEGRLLFANRRFREWFGLEGRDLAEVALEDWVAPEWREILREQDRR